MTQVTRILQAIEDGDAEASNQLLTLVYDELRKLASTRLANERKGHSLQATALVHEAWLRLTGEDGQQLKWNSRGHFFGAAAESMRRILIEHARQKAAKKRGGDFNRIDLQHAEMERLHHPALQDSERLLLLNDALDRLESQDRVKADLVKLRFFAGLTNKQAADALGISDSTADRYWAYARAWLQTEMG